MITNRTLKEALNDKRAPHLEVFTKQTDGTFTRYGGVKPVEEGDVYRALHERRALLVTIVQPPRR